MSQTKPQEDEKLSKAEVGTTVNVTQWCSPQGGRGSMEQRKIDVVVSPACENKNNGQWCCVTHDEFFENQFQKDSHIGDDRKHQLAWNCRQHGIEAP